MKEDQGRLLIQGIHENGTSPVQCERKESDSNGEKTRNVQDSELMRSYVAPS